MARQCSTSNATKETVNANNELSPKFNATSQNQNECEKVNEEILKFENEINTRPLDRRLSEDATTSIPGTFAGSSSDLRPGENLELSTRKFAADDEQQFIKSQVLN